MKLLWLCFSKNQMIIKLIEKKTLEVFMVKLLCFSVLNVFIQNSQGALDWKRFPLNNLNILCFKAYKLHNAIALFE